MSKLAPWWDSWKHPVLWSSIPGIPTALIVATGHGTERLGTAGTWAAITAAVFGTTVAHRSYTHTKGLALTAAENRMMDQAIAKRTSIIKDATDLLECLAELEQQFEIALEATSTARSNAEDKELKQAANRAMRNLTSYIESTFIAAYLRAYASTYDTKPSRR